jgi:hypothetical protein
MKLVLFICIFFASLNLSAESWLKAGVNARGDTFYIDTDSIEKENEVVYYQNLVDFAQPTALRARSHISKYKVDCVENKQTWLDYQYYSQHMGKGKIVTKSLPVWNHYGSTLNEIRSLTVGSVEYDVMKTACGSVGKDKNLR